MENEEIRIGGDIIGCSKSEKLLGIEVASDLTWTKHLENTHGELLKRLGLIRRLRYKLPSSCLKLIADGLFQSKIRYGACLFVNPILNDRESHSGLVEKLQKVQNELNRVLMGVKRSDRIRNKDLSEMTGLQTVNQIACTQMLHELRKIIVEGSIPEMQAALLNKLQNSRDTRAKSDFKLTVPEGASRNSFIQGAVKLWNAAPQSLRDAREYPKEFKAMTGTFVATLP